MYPHGHEREESISSTQALAPSGASAQVAVCTGTLPSVQSRRCVAQAVSHRVSDSVHLIRVDRASARPKAKATRFQRRRHTALTIFHPSGMSIWAGDQEHHSPD